MIIPIVPTFRKRRGRPQVQFGPPPVGLWITSVVVGENPWQLRVTFSAALVWDEFNVPAEFEVVLGASWAPAQGVATWGADWLELEFIDVVPVGAAWQVNAPMSGVTPVVASPQSGVVA